MLKLIQKYWGIYYFLIYFRDQIEEKNKRKLSTNKEEFRESIVLKNEKTISNTNSHNTSVHNDKSAGFASSRHSNSNTAWTRNLFTPSEDNCLSQHLVWYSSIKQNKANQENEQLDPIQDKNHKILNQLWNTVMEERSREEVNTEESIFSLKSPEHTQKNISNKDYITIWNQEAKESSIILLEGAVEALLKEQESLK